MVTPGFDLAIVGGGIVGLATAMRAAESEGEPRVLVLEKEPRLASHQSGRNSGVIHSGLYYRPGSLKAATCVEGARLMLEFVERESIPHLVCGKVIVAATGAEVGRLKELHLRGQANGVAGLSWIGPERLREIESAAAGIAALHVPGAAITDYARVSARFAERAAARGARIVTSARVRKIRRSGSQTLIETTAGEFEARLLINCAGLHSDRVAALAGAPPGLLIAPFRGEYYRLSAGSAARIRGLIYPVPDPAFPFLGVHLTRRIDGSVEAGPNAVLAFSREGYRLTDVAPRDLLETLSFPGFWRMSRRCWRQGLAEYHRSVSRRAFLAALRRLVPALRAEDLEAGGSGVRAQALDRSGTLVDDFRIEAAGGAVHVLNVPSPAATASLSVAGQILARAAAAGLLPGKGSTAIRAHTCPASEVG